MVDCSLKKCEKQAEELSNTLKKLLIPHSILIGISTGVLNYGTDNIKEHMKRKWDCVCSLECQCGKGDKRTLESVFYCGQNIPKRTQK